MDEPPKDSPNSLPEATPKEEIALRERMDQRQFEYAMKSLEAAAKDQADFRAHTLKIHKTNFWALLAFLAVVAALALTALFLGKDEIIKDILKYAAGAAAGGGLTVMLRKKEQPPAK